LIKIRRLRAKKTRRADRRVKHDKSGGPALDERFRDLGRELYRARMIAFNAVQLVATLQHAIELVDEHGDRLVTFIRLDRCIHVRALNLDVALGLELDAGRRIAIAFQFNPHADDALLVAKQSIGFLADERLQGRCQLEVNAGDD
jgi:hypothetical protein